MPDTILVGSPEGLDVLTNDGTRLRHWSWEDVEGWGADGVAPDGTGNLRQVLTFRVRHGMVNALADAAELGQFLHDLAAMSEMCRTRAESSGRRRSTPTRRLAIAAVCMVVLGGAVWGVGSLFPPQATAGHQQARAPDAPGRVVKSTTIHLAKATAAPAPEPATLATAPLAAHEAFGFLPYWVLPNPSSIDLSGTTTVAYFSVDVTAAGTVDESPSNPGWTGYQSQALADIVTQAHDSDVRVVLTATCFDQSALDVLTHDPGAQATLAATLVALVRAKNLDGINLDFEGTGPTDRSGLDHLVATVGRALHTADPNWQFTVDTYASSAEDAGGFYDVSGMAPFVDAFVVMAYDMGDTFAAGPTAPRTGSGITDTEVVSSYVSAAGRSKVILGMPLYGEDWPTTGPTAGDPATGPPKPVADDEVAATDTVYWDPKTDGPWAVYRNRGRWYQIWFDDPASLAAKARLVRAAGLRGEALWALGMAVGTEDQEAAFFGISVEPQPPDGPVTIWRGRIPILEAPAKARGKSGPSGAAVGSAPAAATLGSVSAAALPDARGVFGGVTVSLVPWPEVIPSKTTAAGFLATFAAPGTALACLAIGPPLPVVKIAGTSAYIVRAGTPTDCVSGVWAFVLPAGSSAASSPGGSGTGPDSKTGGETGATGGSTTTSTTGVPSGTTTTSTTAVSQTTTTTTGVPSGTTTTSTTVPEATTTTTTTVPEGTTTTTTTVVGTENQNLTPAG